MQQRQTLTAVLQLLLTPLSPLLTAAAVAAVAAAAVACAAHTDMQTPRPLAVGTSDGRMQDTLPPSKGWAQQQQQ